MGGWCEYVACVHRTNHVVALFSKISRYSPSESAKIYEKSIQRHPVAEFQPKTIVAIIRELDSDAIATTATATAAGGGESTRPPAVPLSDKQKAVLVERYLDVSIQEKHS